MLQLIHVGKRFGARWAPTWWAPTRFSLEVKPGELVWLDGPSGAGKSVVVRLALGLILPTTGSVNVNGVNPAKVSRAARQSGRRRISAVLGDEPELDLPVESWVALGLWCAGQPWAKSVNAAREALERADLRELAGQRYRELAPGRRFAVTLVRALEREPDLLLVDWPGPHLETLPEKLAEELIRYTGDGGACLVIGGPTGRTSRLGGRTERLELERGAG